MSFFILVFLHCLGIAVAFGLISKICSLHFIQSLDLISKKMKFQRDISGATFMAIGSSAPELFMSLFALTKIGSAIFNILVILGGSAIVATTVLRW